MSADLNSESQRATTDAERRAFLRRPQDTLECNFGPILDLSAAGVRVISTKPLIGVVELHLKGTGIDLVCKARTAWCRKIAFRMYEGGLEFQNRKSIQHLTNWIAEWSGKNISE